MFKARVEFVEEYTNSFKDCYTKCIKNNPGVGIDWLFVIPFIRSPFDSPTQVLLSMARLASHSDFVTKKPSTNVELPAVDLMVEDVNEGGA